MTTETDSDLDAIRKVTVCLDAAIQPIADGQWTLPTPCPGWDLSALVDHVTGGNWFTILVLTGCSADDALAQTMDQFGGTGATIEHAAGSLSDQLMAFSRPNVLEHTWNHVSGDLDGRQILRLRLHDLIVHLWDIGQTVDSRFLLPEELVNWGLNELADGASLMSQHADLADDPDFGAIEDSAVSYLYRFDRVSL